MGVGVSVGVRVAIVGKGLFEGVWGVSVKDAVGSGEGVFEGVGNSTVSGVNVGKGAGKLGVGVAVHCVSVSVGVSVSGGVVQATRAITINRDRRRNFDLWV